MQQDFAELTVAAVESVFGPLTAAVYSILAHYGRQNLRGLMKYARVLLPQVTFSLVILVQHHLVFYDVDDFGQTYYTANGANAYNIAFRIGKYTKLIDDRFGHNAAYVFTKVATLGQATIRDIVEECSRELEAEQTTLIIQDLLRFGCLWEVTAHHFQPENVLADEVEIMIEADNGGPLKGKVAENRAITQRLDYKRAFRERSFQNSNQSGEFASKRRKITQSYEKGSTGVDDGSHGSKSTNGISASKGTNGTTRSSQGTPGINPDLVFCINYEKCTALLRNQQLIRFAHRHTSDVTAKVFEALLLSIEGKVMRCFDEYELRKQLLSKEEGSPVCSSSTQLILDYLDLTGLDLSFGSADRAPHSQPQSSKRKTTHETSRVLELLPHLKLLRRILPQFVRTTSSDEWFVPFKSITRLLLQTEIENAITARFGLMSSRIIRILHENYSADEKFLQHASILKFKEVRAVTNALTAAGFVQVQEIPRDGNRTTGRLLWLYGYDPIKARETLIISSYRAMFRLLRRIEAERKRNQLLINKSERTDVKGKENELLSEEERASLERFAEVEKALLAHIGRIDDLIACLRDFAPLDDPFIGNRKHPDEADGKVAAYEENEDDMLVTNAEEDGDDDDD